MAAKQKHECTTHNVTFCVDTKFMVNIKRAEMAKVMSSVNYSQVVNAIIEEWAEMKKIDLK